MIIEAGDGGEISFALPDRDRISVSQITGDIAALDKTSEGLLQCTRQGEGYDPVTESCTAVCQQLGTCAEVACTPGDASQYGYQRMTAEGPQVCGAEGWEGMGGAAPGSTRQIPAADCDEAVRHDASLLVSVAAHKWRHRPTTAKVRATGTGLLRREAARACAGVALRAAPAGTRAATAKPKATPLRAAPSSWCRAASGPGPPPRLELPMPVLG